jgi:hypothetical protein
MTLANGFTQARGRFDGLFLLSEDGGRTKCLCNADWKIDYAAASKKGVERRTSSNYYNGRRKEHGTCSIKHDS